jgi:tetratricopeptide (TPR) repeat protein
MRSWVLVLACTLAMAAGRPSFGEESLSAEMQTLILAAKAGDANAQLRVGSAYDTGRGAPRDGKAAMMWYRLSAEQGNAEAQNSVGSGLQAEKQYAEAMPWYERAAAQGNALATNNLAYLYDQGLGVLQDRRKAFDLYARAADLKSADAMWNIATMYASGQLGKKDMFMACVWADRAIRFAGSADRKLLDRASAALTHLQQVLRNEQYLNCLQQAEAWSPSDAGTKLGIDPGSAMTPTTPAVSGK